MNSRTVRRLPLLGGAALLAVLALPATVAAASTAGAYNGASYNCTGGNVPPGTYGSMVITGICTMNHGDITIAGNLRIAPKALLDAVAPDDPASKPTVPAVVTVRGNVLVGAGAVLLLGCSPNISCGPPAPGITYDHVGGSLMAFGAQAVVVHSASVKGNVTVLGGGGGKAAYACQAQPSGKPVNKALAPWSEDPSLDFTPVYTDVEDTTVGGNLAIASVYSCWLGTLRNHIDGNASFTGNRFGDPDAMEVNANLIRGSLACFRNVPAVQFGEGNSAANLIGRAGYGQCGLGVVLPNPSLAAIAAKQVPGPSVPEHIAVSLSSLRTYAGTDMATSVGGLPQVTTSSGDIISANFYNFVISGSGLTGYGKFNPKLGPSASGQNVLSTTFPNGSSTFTVYITCTCRFRGHSGTISIRAYGTSTRAGATSGTFLIDSGGGTPHSGSLATIVGWGTFASRGPSAKLSLVEYLGFAS